MPFFFPYFPRYFFFIEEVNSETKKEKYVPPAGHNCCHPLARKQFFLGWPHGKQRDFDNFAKTHGNVCG